MMKWHGDVFRHYRTLELKVPEDVSVIGYDDSTLSAYYGVPLTTVHSQLSKWVVQVQMSYSDC